MALPNILMQMLTNPRAGMDSDSPGVGASPMTPPMASSFMPGESGGIPGGMATSPMRPVGSFADVVNGVLAPYGLSVGNRQNLLLPEPGTSGFFGQHPNLSRGLETALVGAATARPGMTTGDTISSIANSVLGAPMQRNMMLMQRNVGVPMQYAQQVMGLQQEQAKTASEQSQAAMYQAHANYYNNYTRRRFSGQPYPVKGPDGNIYYAQTDDMDGTPHIMQDPSGNPMQVPSGFRGTGKSGVLPPGVKTTAERQAFSGLSPDEQDLVRNWYATGDKSDPETKAALTKLNGEINRISTSQAAQRAGAVAGATDTAHEPKQTRDEALKGIDEDYKSNVQNFPKYEDWMLSRMLGNPNANASVEAYNEDKRKHLTEAQSDRDRRKQEILSKSVKTSPMAPSGKSQSQPSTNKGMKITTSRGTVVEIP